MLKALWDVLSEKEILNVGGRLRVVLQHVRLQDGHEVEDYLRLRMPPFVVIVAQTEDGRILCERQYKHGPQRVILTLPAGSIEAGETPMEAAKRELLEETGFVSDDWAVLAEGMTHANSRGSHSHSFVACGCRKVVEPNSGDLEEMTIEALTPAELLALRPDEMPILTDAAALFYGLRALGIVKGP